MNPQTLPDSDTAEAPGDRVVREAQRLHLNLEALAASQPDVAGQLARIDIPESVRAVTGRDGSDTYLLPGPPDRLHWLGGSSMPTVSVPEITAPFRFEGFNAVVPGVLTGLEPLVVVERCPAHAAVFVLEDSALCARLALQLYDYRAVFERLQLVLLIGEPFSDKLAAFLARNPGYEMPARLVKTPQRTAAQIARLQRDLEEVGRVHAGHVEARIAQLKERIAAHRREPITRTSRFAVVGVDPHPAAIAHGRAVASAIEANGGSAHVCLPDRPDRCHHLARLEAIAEAQADGVLVTGGAAGALADLIPTDLPILTWPRPGFVNATHAINPERRADRVIIASIAEQDHFQSAGLPAERIRLAPLPLSTTNRADQYRDRKGAVDQAFQYHHRKDEGGHTDQYRDREGAVSRTNQYQVRERAANDVAIFADLPDDRPEAAGVTLTSHIALWKALQAEYLDRTSLTGKGNAEDALQRGERRSGTKLSEEGMRKSFTNAIHQRIAPACTARALVAELLQQGIRVAVWGHNWPARTGGPDIRRGPIPMSDQARQAFQQTRIALWLDPTPINVHAAAQAIAAGTSVILRANIDSLAQQYSPSADLLRYAHGFTTGAEAVACVSRLLATDERSRPPTELIEPHSYPSIMRDVIDSGPKA